MYLTHHHSASTKTPSPQALVVTLDLRLQVGMSKSHLNDIEKGRKAVSPDRAARFAKVLGYSQARLDMMVGQRS
jgi:hypothetical protein